MFTPSIAIAELSDNFHSGNLESNSSLEELLDFVETESGILKIGRKPAESAGSIKREIREKFSDFGLADAIILSIARENDLQLLTGDGHLTGRSEVIDLKTDKFST